MAGSRSRTAPSTSSTGRGGCPTSRRTVTAGPSRTRHSSSAEQATAAAPNTVSADRCEQTLDFTCSTTDGEGTQRWVMVLEQVGEDHIVGTGTVQLDHPQGTCRSTYDL